MGGGDLNLKKSWHPSTLRNIERVWKAEQKHEVEKSKIEQLQKELAEERSREEIQTYAEDQGVVRKKAEKLDWMYQGPASMVNRDEYLLGRKVDKTFETLQKLESGKEGKDEEASDIGAITFSSQNLSGSATVDLATKIREDPLFSIMKKEKEQRKNLLSNPVKMKQLQQMLESSLSSKKHKKHKKDKKKKKHSSDSSDEETNRKRSKNHQRSTLEEFYERQKKQSRRERSDAEENHKHRNRRKREGSESDDDSYERKKFKNSYLETKSSQKYSSHQRKDLVEPFDPRNKREKRTDFENKNYRRNESHSNGYSERGNQGFNESSKKKMDAKERERRLREMEDNAKWREDQRKRNTQRYREEDEREESSAKRVDTEDFLKPMLSRAAGKGSLESRVKQKIFTLQRGKADMDKNFLRR